MSNITSDQIKELRERTGVAVTKCKEALVESSGDMEKAIEYLRKIGMASAVKKAGREAKEGAINSYETEKALALLELSSETDFVAKNERFQEFLADIVKQIAETETPSLDKLLDQPYAKDPTLTVEQQRNLLVQALGENIQLKRMALLKKPTTSSFGVYSHMGGKIVTMVEISGGAGQEELAKDIAMHVAAEDPDYLKPEEIPQEVKEKEMEIARSQVTGKPEAIIDKIVEGKWKAFSDQVCLIKQKFIKDPSLSVENYVEKQGKSLKVERFLRWKVGE